MASTATPLCVSGWPCTAIRTRGGHWEQKCDSHLKSVGIDPIVDWRSCYFHKKLQKFFIVCFDDFKLCGPVANLKKGWELMRKGIKMDDPSPLGKFLGCDHVVGKASLHNGGVAPNCGQ